MTWKRYICRLILCARERSWKLLVSSSLSQLQRFTSSACATSLRFYAALYGDEHTILYVKWSSPDSFECRRASKWDSPLTFNWFYHLFASIHSAVRAVFFSALVYFAGSGRSNKRFFLRRLALACGYMLNTPIKVIRFQENQCPKQCKKCF